MEKVPFTINGLENLKNEFNNLKKKFKDQKLLKLYRLPVNMEICQKMLNIMLLKKNNHLLKEE